MDKKSIMIGGVDVKFPFKPYPSQLQMMSMVIRGLQQEKNCLLESPTGSGKTLALLCAALAWQEKRREELMSIKMDPECNQNTKGLRVPKIYYGSRTHKQIAQVINELKTTAYKNVRMTVLSSRNHSCVHPVNLASGSLNDGCRKLVHGLHPNSLGDTCSYKHNVKAFRTHSSLKKVGLSGVWDLEDLVEVGRRSSSCPYFVSKELLVGANIVFCPYNYLTDPLIRSSMSLDLKDQIVILDEGHNIEDNSRQAASYTLNEGNLTATIEDVDRLINKEFRVEAMQDMLYLCRKIGAWIKSQVEQLVQIEYEVRNKVWSGDAFLNVLEEWGVNSSTLSKLRESFDEAKKREDEEFNEEDGEEDISKQEKFETFLNSTSIAVLEGIFFVIDNMFHLDHMYKHDYKVALIETKEYVTQRPDPTRGFVRIHRKPVKQKVLNLHFWCLNPAVSFKKMSSSHSIILTSGTLSPMSSFESELGVPFPIKLEASHVIPSSQVWVGSVGCGPTEVELQATYKNVHTLQFQDELGSIVKHVCDITPKGVLCFFTSYSTMNLMAERWKSTGLWEAISEKKHIFNETSGKNSASFDELISDFYSSVEHFGALLLAVCRGKISEGLDFSDDNARAVITVGIPFPNFKDRQVSLKKQYNNANTMRGLLTGDKWYEIQAYRAINQALGRCIRHRNDWGALIMVDKRFVTNPQRYCSGLSKWIRDKLKIHSRFDTAIASLQEFCDQMKLTKSEHKVSKLNRTKQRSSKKPVVNKFFSPKMKQEVGPLISRSNSHHFNNVETKLHSFYDDRKENLQSKIDQVKVEKKSIFDEEDQEESKNQSLNKKVTSAYFNKSSFNYNNVSDTERSILPTSLKSKIVSKKEPKQDYSLKSKVPNQVVIKKEPNSPTKFTAKYNVKDSINAHVKKEIKTENSDQTTCIENEKTTPNKDLNITMVPESPEEVINSSLPDIVTDSASKQNQFSDDDDFTPFTKRKRSKRKNSEALIKNQNCSKKLGFEEDDGFTPKKKKKTRKAYRVCCQSVGDLESCNLKFNYISQNFPRESDKLKTCDAKSFVKVTAEALKKYNSKLSFDCVWCEVDNFAYQFHCCPSCDKIIGFQVKNLNNLNPDKLIVFNSVCSRS